MGSSGSSGWNTAGGGAVSARGISRRSPPLGVGPGAPSIDEINVPVLRLDRKCRITFANSTAATLFGVAAEELVGHRVEDFLAGEARLEGLFAIARSEGSAQDLVDLENGIRLSLTVFPDASVYNRMGTIVRLRNVDGALPHGRPDHRQIAALQQAIDVALDHGPFRVGQVVVRERLNFRR